MVHDFASEIGPALLFAFDVHKYVPAASASGCSAIRWAPQDPGTIVLFGEKAAVVVIWSKDSPTVPAYYRTIAFQAISDVGLFPFQTDCILSA